MRAMLGAIAAAMGAALVLGPGTPAPVVAQPTGPPVAVERVETAPVIVDGETLFSLRGISSYPAKQRAEDVAREIRAVARDAALPASALRVVDTGDRSKILAGERHILSVFDADARAELAQARHTLAGFFQAAIARTIDRYRHERSGAYLRAQAVRAAIALAVLVALLFALRRLFRWLGQAVERRVQSHFKTLEARSFRLLSADEMRSAWQGGLRALHVLAAFVLILAGLDYVLSLFPWTRYAARRGTRLLVDPLTTMGNGVIDALPGLVFIAILVVITRYVLKLVRLFFSGVAQGTIRPSRFDPDWAWPTYRLLRLVIIAFAAILAYPYIPGSETEAFKGVSIFVGLLMSLGAASMVANSLAGYALIYRRAFKVGDRIQVGDVIGDVVEIRQQVTQLRTPKNEVVTLPSSMILTSHVINFSALARQGGLILHTTVGIGYETPWRQVEAMLIAAANRTAGLLREPPPFVLQKALGDFAVTYEINAYTDTPQQMARLYTALHQSVLDVFNEYGVQIMTPAYEGDPAQPKVVPKDQWHTAPARPADTKPG